MSTHRQNRLKLYNFRFEIMAIRTRTSGGLIQLPDDIMILIADYLPDLNEEEALARQMRYFSANQTLGSQYIKKLDQWQHFPTIFVQRNRPYVKCRTNKFPARRATLQPVYASVDQIKKNSKAAIFIENLLEERAFNTKKENYLPLEWKYFSPVFTEYLYNLYIHKAKLALALRRAVATYL